jgi:hypothetical protein
LLQRVLAAQDAAPASPHRRSASEP